MARKKILSAALILVIAFFPSPGKGFTITSHIGNEDIHISSAARHVGQGEILKITIRSAAVSGASARLNGNDYAFVSSDDDRFFTLVPLPIDMAPGRYALTFTVNTMDGKNRQFTSTVNVSSTEFPFQRITVNKQYVTPPDDVIERIMKEVDLVTGVYASGTDAWLGTGAFIIPSQGAIRKNFGEKRIFNNERHSIHKGVDIRSAYGWTVSAANAGKIVLARDLYFAGHTVIIDHGVGLFSLYCHLSRIHVREGQTVAKGALIGSVGATGRVTGPHLHWGVKLCGHAVNPLSLIALPFD